MDSSCNRKTCKLSGDSIPELGDGEPSPPPELVCVITHNPVGTDTWAEGYECPCGSCQKWLRENSPELLTIEIARELYDRFRMGGWEPQDAYPMIKRWIEEVRSGAAQEVSPVGSVQKITGPERPRCPRCGAETTCLSCGTKISGDTRELKAALKLVTEKFREHFREGDHTMHWRDALNALAEAERLLGEPTKE